MKLVITERDRKLFQYLFENKIASRRQITRDIFVNISKQTINRRLQKLRDNKYLNVHTVLLKNIVTFVYFVTPKGIREIKDQYRHLITGKTLKSNSPYHDLNLVDIRFQMNRLGLVNNYFSENVLQCCEEFSWSDSFKHFVNLNCDGVMELKTPKGPFLVALEYDFSDKSAERYRSKLLEYYVSLDIRVVLYICENKFIYNLLKRIDQEVCENGFKSKIFYCLRKNIHNCAKGITFTNINNDIFTLR